MKFEILFPQSTFNACREHLLREVTRENMVFCWAGHILDNDTTRFLVYKFESVPHEEFDVHSGSYIQIKKYFYQDKVRFAYKNKSHLIIWHSHPFANNAYFSATDNENDNQQGKYLNKKIPKLYFIAMLSGQKSTSARIYCKNNSIRNIDRLTILSRQGYAQIFQNNNEKKRWKNDSTETAWLSVMRVKCGLRI